MPRLTGQEIVLGVCGGIAAYKTADLVSKLVQAGAGVTVAMTPDAVRFVTPLTFQALSGRPVHTDIWTLPDPADPQHIRLTEKADLLLIAPATAHTIAKISHGLCDDIVSLLAAAAACPIAYAPAMNNRMWENPIAQENVQRLKKFGHHFIGPEAGWLACRNVGAGRLAEPAEIVEAVTRVVSAGKPRLPKRAASIRPIAICLFRRGDSILVFEGYDSVKQNHYYRPLGGGIEPGEPAVDALRREIREETGEEITDLRLLDAIENTFECDGKPKHEIVFVFDGRFADPSVYDRESLSAAESDGTPLNVAWRSPDFFGPTRRLVPEALMSIIGDSTLPRRVVTTG